MKPMRCEEKEADPLKPSVGEASDEGVTYRMVGICLPLLVIKIITRGSHMCKHLYPPAPP